jgi:Eco29kI restriction endonuclease
VVEEPRIERFQVQVARGHASLHYDGRALTDRAFSAAWNVCIAGFGLHDPGSRGHQGEIPWWDTLHLGRAWAARLRQTRTNAAAEQQLANVIQGTRRPTQLTPPAPIDVTLTGDAESAEEYEE